MIESTAEVIAVSGERVRLRALAPESHCGACTGRQGCGVGALGRLFSSRERIFDLDAGAGLQVGQRVVLGIDESILQRAAMLAYLLPLLGLLGGAIVGTQLATTYDFPAELLAIVASLLGATIAIWLVRRRMQHSDARYQPRVLRVEPDLVKQTAPSLPIASLR